MTLRFSSSAFTFVVAATCLAVSLPGCGKIDDSSLAGFNAIATFGDGAWTIFKTETPGKGRRIHLHNGKTQETLVFDIGDWYTGGDMVYAVSKDGKYGILNSRTGFTANYNQLEEAPPEYRTALSRLRTH